MILVLHVYVSESHVLPVFLQEISWWVTVAGIPLTWKQNMIDLYKPLKQVHDYEEMYQTEVTKIGLNGEFAKI